MSPYLVGWKRFWLCLDIKPSANFVCKYPSTRRYHRTQTPKIFPFVDTVCNASLFLRYCHRRICCCGVPRVQKKCCSGVHVHSVKLLVNLWPQFDRTFRTRRQHVVTHSDVWCWKRIQKGLQTRVGPQTMWNGCPALARRTQTELDTCTCKYTNLTRLTFWRSFQILSTASETPESAGANISLSTSLRAVSANFSSDNFASTRVLLVVARLTVPDIASNNIRASFVVWWVVIAILRVVNWRLTSSVSRGRSYWSNFDIISLRAGLLRYERSARPHARMQLCCRLASHLEKWLYPPTGCIHWRTSCLLVLVGTSSGGTCKKIEANTVIIHAPSATTELYSYQFVQQTKNTRQKSRETEWSK